MTPSEAIVCDERLDAGRGSQFGGDEVAKFAHQNRLTLTASTDDLGNTFVFSHFVSCKCLLSIVVMELASQLKRFGLEMDLGWIPRSQNSEADVLTNSGFEGFKPNKRIATTFEDYNG